MSDQARGWTEEQMCHRVLADLWEGAYVNLGVGMPIGITKFLSPDSGVILHSENGLLGMGNPPAEGQQDADIINAGSGFVTLWPGASNFDSSLSFMMVRGGHVDVAVLGAYQVDQHGNLANWKRPGQTIASIGGAADISAGAKQVWVLMKHRTNDGKEARLLKDITFPLTAKACVKRVYTDMGVVHVTSDGFRLVETGPGYTPAEVVTATDAPLITA